MPVEHEESADKISNIDLAVLTTDDEELEIKIEPIQSYLKFSNLEVLTSTDY